MSAQEQRSPSYDSLLVIAQSVCAALARAGVTDCDDPGEAIDVMRENLEARVAFLESERRRLQEGAAPQPPAEAQPSAWRILWSPDFPETCELTSDGERVLKVQALDDPPYIQPLYAAPAEAQAQGGVVVTAKPLEWQEDGPGEWCDRHHGFHITKDDEEPQEDRFTAAWGEGDPERFPTLEEAQAWCQEAIDRYIREWAITAPPSAPVGVASEAADFLYGAGTHDLVVRTAAPSAPDRDAYEGAREDLLDWKHRAQRAEATLRGLGYKGIDASEPPSAPVGVEGLHPETADLVRRFAHAVAEKLAEAERKYGWDTHWKSPAWMDQCREQLVAHVAKGDPRDVAAYAAFLWHHGEPTALAQQPAHPPGTPMMPRGRFHDALWKSLPAGVQHHARVLTQSWVTADSTELKNALEAAVLSLAQQPAAVDGAMVERHTDAALAHMSNALDDLDSNPDQRPVPLIREAMEHLRELRAALAAQPGGSNNG